MMEYVTIVLRLRDEQVWSEQIYPFLKSRLFMREDDVVREGWDVTSIVWLEEPMTDLDGEHA